MNSSRDLTEDLAMVLRLAERQIQTDAATANMTVEREALARIQNLHDRVAQHQVISSGNALSPVPVLPKQFADQMFGRERG